MYLFNHNSKIALHLQLYEYIKEDILNNYKIDEKLPSIRKTASLYNLSKNTVQNAYSQLLAEGYIKSYEKSGYFVEDIKKNEFKENLENISKKINKDENFLYDFVPARLEKSTFPLKIWKRLFNKYINSDLDFGTYSSGQGEYELRVEIAKYLNKSRAVTCDINQIILTSGFLDSLSIITKLLKKKASKTIAIESPGYYLTYKSFEDYDYKIESLPIDKNGIKLETLKNIKADLLYLTPSHQYPSGVRIPISNRVKILQWAKDNNCLILEDDYDSELSYINRPIPSLQGLDNNDSVIYLGTFSKALCAALRMSYLVLPKHLVLNYENFYANKFSSVPLMMQKTLEMFMKEGYWEKHLRKMRNLNRKKHNLMKNALIFYLKETVEIQNSGAGLAILITSTKELDFEKLKDLAKKEKIKIYFTNEVSSQKCQILRMGFGGFKEKEIEKAIEAFSKIWYESIKN